MTASSSDSNCVALWFGYRFGELHPLLQRLHRKGGRLSGDIKLQYGQGFAGWFGRRIGRKMGLPEAGQHHMSVTISHTAQDMCWNRCFNNEHTMRSNFIPIGSIENGHWREKSGAISLMLTVDTQQGGWYWKCIGARLMRIPIPLFLLPKVTAFKRIENGQYRFFVSISMPLLSNPLLTYQGTLLAQP